MTLLVVLSNFVDYTTTACLRECMEYFIEKGNYNFLHKAGENFVILKKIRIRNMATIAQIPELQGFSVSRP